MKKLISYILAGILICMQCSPVFADGYDSGAERKSLSEYNNETNIEEAPGMHLSAVMDGIKFAENMNAATIQTNGELWTLQSSQAMTNDEPITGSFGEIVPVGETVTKTCSWSISAGLEYKNFKISATVSGSHKFKAQSGPSSTDKLVNGKAATHRAFFAIGYGTLYKYSYRITDKYSGAYKRTEVKYIFTNTHTKPLSQLINYASNNVYVENGDRTKVKNAGTYTNYVSKFSKTDGTCTANYYF